MSRRPGVPSGYFLIHPLGSYHEPQALWISVNCPTQVLSSTEISPDPMGENQDGHMTSNQKDGPEVGAGSLGECSREGTPKEEEPSPLRQSALRAPTKAGKSTQMRFKHSFQRCKSTPLP